MPVELKLDHIVVSTELLADGVAYVEGTLGVSMAAGGKHAAMGTHNALLGLGEAYLEVIAIDLSARPPVHPRWFGLDTFTGAPRLTNWVVKAANLDAALALAPPGVGTPMELTRGELRWVIAVSPEGTLPFDGAFPGFIDWGDTTHPSKRLPDVGCRLERFEISHPDAEGVRVALAEFGGGLQDWVTARAPLGFEAHIETPSGRRVLF